ncbi:uncharacterized protein LOC141907646 [Tubulanus polymorphus]|uniref:uncharacterized protein LOC141907646 n=1 Tax=Tubulanus polymorphus TaxID=672921 RepID=UPI003DA32E4F
MEPVVLKSSDGLKTVDIIPMLLKLRGLDLNVDRPTAFARFERLKPLEAAPRKYVDDAVFSLTGKKMNDLLTLVDWEETEGPLLAHHLIIFANENANKLPQVPKKRKSVPAPSTSTVGAESDAVTPDGVSEPDKKLLKRLEELEKKVTHPARSVESALMQVRAALQRPGSFFDPYFLLGCMEGLVEVAAETTDPKKGYFDSVLKSIKRNIDSPDLPALCRRLIGYPDDEKVASVEAKWAKKPHTNNYYPTYGYWGGSGVGRGYVGRRGYGTRRAGRSSRGNCFLCRKEGHFVRDCPENKQPQVVTKTESEVV